MPPFRPFPFPNLSIGTDIAHIPRIAKFVRDRVGFPKFLRKVLTTREQQDFYARYGKGLRKIDMDEGKRWNHAMSEQEYLIRAANHLAGRWAAKEAIVKACSWRRLTFGEIQVLADKDSRRIYGVILDHASAKIPEEQMNTDLEAPNGSQNDEPGQIVKVSISHDGEYATAVCMAAVEPSPGDVGGEAAAREPF